jgi:hypothetical protein
MTREEKLRAIEEEGQANQQLDAPLSFEPITRTFARMVLEAREHLEDLEESCKLPKTYSWD